MPLTAEGFSSNSFSFSFKSHQDLAISSSKCFSASDVDEAMPRRRVVPAKAAALRGTSSRVVIRERLRTGKTAAAM